MLNHIYPPFALGLKIIKYVLNNVYVCLFIVMKIIVKITVRKLDFSHMTFKGDFTSFLLLCLMLNKFKCCLCISPANVLFTFSLQISEDRFGMFKQKCF